MKKIIILLVLSAILTNCTPPQKSEPESMPTVEKKISGPISVDLSEIPTVDAEENSPPVVIPAPGQRSSKEKLIHLVSLDLSKRLGIDISEVTLLESDPVIWEDSSLGCSAPGESYTQAEISGFRIIMEAQNTEYEYHSKGLDEFIWCNNNTPVPPLD